MFLVLFSDRAGRFNVLDYASFPAHVEVGQLKAEFLGLPSESFLLRLSQNHAGAPTALILAADTRYPKFPAQSHPPVLCKQCCVFHLSLKFSLEFLSSKYIVWGGVENNNVLKC